jgi:hypothetical protein
VTEGPPEAPPAAAAYRPWVRRQLQDHPGTWLTFLYLALTAIGLTYAFAYHAPFRINFLDYAETSDFLLAALREPVAIILSLLPALAIWVAIRLHRIAEPRVPAYRRYVARREAKYERRQYRYAGGRAQYWDLANTMLVVIYAVVFTLYYGLHHGRRLLDGGGRRVRVQLVTGALGTSPDKPPVLVGSTARYLFLYSPEQDSTYAVSADNVAFLALKPRPRRPTLFLRLWRRAMGDTAGGAPAPRR